MGPFLKKFKIYFYLSTSPRYRLPNKCRKLVITAPLWSKNLVFELSCSVFTYYRYLMVSLTSKGQRDWNQQLSIFKIQYFEACQS